MDNPQVSNSSVLSMNWNRKQVGEILKVVSKFWQTISMREHVDHSSVKIVNGENSEWKQVGLYVSFRAEHKVDFNHRYCV